MLRERCRTAPRAPGAQGPSAASHLPPGTHINQYELIRELGRGGMGAVYLARDTDLGRLVAIKVLHSDAPERTERFLLEARATARCSHENIVVIHEVGVFRDSPFMVLEHLSGQPLTSLMKAQVMAPERAVALAVPVVRALVCAHAHGIVHRDLKPDNIIITDAGVIKVLDFGIAKLLREQPRTRPTPPTRAVSPDSARTELTRQGTLLGTYSYMSPEQWGAGEVDHRTDIWAVGILLFQMATGRHPLWPLRGEQLAVTAVLDQPMPCVCGVQVEGLRALADIIDHCLIKPKEQRMPDARALLAALLPLLPPG